MPYPNVIAIDGPAGSGKSTISFYLAEKLGYLFIDTGVFYRSVTLLVLRHNVNVTNTAALATVTRDAVIDIRPEPQDPERQYSVWIEGDNVTDQLRTEAVNKLVSTVAAVPEVRHELMNVQRRAAIQGKIIMAGRDIGTVVLPDADCKLYIDASIEERARRRYKQKQEKGEQVDLAAIEQSLRQRDEVDMQREVSPLKQADDALYVLTDGMSVEEVVQHVLASIET